MFQYTPDRIKDSVALSESVSCLDFSSRRCMQCFDIGSAAIDAFCKNPDAINGLIVEGSARMKSNFPN